ncbi:flagellar protein FlaG [Pseudomonas sp. LS44]|uniref:flagellar protein FlaG n=1 Tax=Pseudomonas sp. LS44 TaxID=1357074 RepID=UPI00215A6171|nr:flagellar protein FlaG [Pseudomonas sp. LS44]UVE16384.1 flagellar protein FlaG [Pseudomonas sp. LS44]
MDISKLSSNLSAVSAGLDAPRTGVSSRQKTDLSAALVTEQGSGNPGSQGDIDTAVANMSSFVQSVQRNLDFSVDDTTGDVVIKVVDRDSGKLVRQIPSEEALRLSEQLEELRSLMFETRA